MAHAAVEAVRKDRVACARISDEHAAAPSGLAVALRVQAGNECDIAARVDRGPATKDGIIVVVLANLARAEVGVDQIGVADRVHQPAAVADVDRLAGRIPGSKRNPAAR